MEKSQGIEREIEEGIYKMYHQAEEMLHLTGRGLIGFNSGLLKEAEKIGEEINREEKRLTNLLVEEALNKSGETEDIKPLIAFLGHLKRIEDNLESIINYSTTIIKEGILFSNKAIKELEHLFQSTNNLLKNAGDIILTRNKALINHLIEEGRLFNKTADQYMAEHLERLVTGVCLSKASPFYLNLLDYLKGIVWHTRKTAEISASRV